jgi:hypothetical protein
MFLKQSTAVTLKIGPFLDSTDGNTAETGLTIAQADVRLSKNGGDIAQKNEATSCTHDELGVYGCPIDATDTNTLGRLQLWVHESGALVGFHEYMVVTANFYDTLFSTDQFDVNVTNVAGTSQTGNDNGADINTILSRVTGNVALASVVGALDDAAAAGDVTSADTLMQYIKQLINILIGTPGVATFPAEAAPGNAVSLAEVIRAIHADVTGLNGDAMRGTDSAALASVCTETRLSELDSGNLPADVDAILADTGTDGVVVADKTGFALSTAGVNAIWDATEALTGNSLSFETLLTRMYRFSENKLNITDATGSVALRNEADSANIATQTITDDDTTTIRTALTWT